MTRGACRVDRAALVGVEACEGGARLRLAPLPLLLAPPPLFLLQDKVSVRVHVRVRVRARVRARVRVSGKMGVGG